MKKQWFDRLIPVFFLILAVIFFREYFFSRKVPLPFNLLASFYSPWKYYAWPGYESGVPNKPLGNDNIKLFYPYKKFSIDELKAGRLPLWNPYVFSGNVHHGTYQTALFYPLNIVYFLLPLVDAWSVMLIIQPIFTGWFMYLFLRSLKLEEGASFFGALAFAFSGWMLSHWQEVLVIEHSVLWLPLALYASNILWDSQQRIKGVILLVGSLVSSILAGFPQAIIYVFGTVIIWNIYRWFSQSATDRVKRFEIIFGSILLSIALGAIQWMSALEAYFLAPRARLDSSYLFQTFLSPLFHLITFIAPDFFGNPGAYNYFSKTVYLQERTIFIGLPALVFALFIIFRKTKGTIAFWKYFTLITFSLGFALPTSWIVYILHIPVLSVAMPVRIFMLAVFGFCTLSAFGVEEFMKTKSAKSIRSPMIFIGVSLAILWFFVLLMKVFDSHSMYATVSLRNLILPSGFFLSFVIAIRLWYRKPKYLYGAFCLITLVGSVYFANKLLYFSDRQFEYPVVPPITELKKISGYDRVWSYGEGHILRNILSYYRIYSPEGYEALYSHRYGTLLNTIQTKGVLSDLIHRNDATLSETGPTESMTYNPIRLRIMSLLGVKYVLEAKDSNLERFPSDLFRLSWEDNKWRIWEYKQSLPRTFFASNSIVESEPQKIVDTLLDSSTDLRTTIVLEDEYAIPGIGQINSGNATITSYQSSRVEIAVDAKSDGFLFLSDTYYPGWKAFVDDKEVKIYRANYAFRAVPVPTGNHSVSFIYDPISFKIGVGISVIGFVLIFLFLVTLRNIDESKE